MVNTAKNGEAENEEKPEILKVKSVKFNFVMNLIIRLSSRFTASEQL